MSDPHVRETDRVADTDGYENRARPEEFAQYLVRACWEAARQDGAP